MILFDVSNYLFTLSKSDGNHDMSCVNLFSVSL